MATLRFQQWWALAAALGVGCSINTAGLSADGGPVVPPATGGSPGSGGGIALPGTGGDPGSGGQLGSGGRPGSGGTGSGGAFETGGGTGGDVATGGAGAGGRVASGSGGASSTGGKGSGGASSTGGTSSTGGSSNGGASSTGGNGSGGASSTGGSGSGGASSSGGSGSGGASGAGGSGGGGRAGTGGQKGNCNPYPNAVAFVLPDDNRVHCYWFREELRTWREAQDQCRAEKGGELVTITDPAENEVVRGVARFTGSFPQVWIGATDGRAETDTKGPGTYRWVTNEPWAAYTNWNQSSPKQPDGYCDPCDNGKDCTCDHRGTMAADGTWFDFWEKNARAYVCEAVATAN